jgi:hypothetical protein
MTWKVSNTTLIYVVRLLLKFFLISHRTTIYRNAVFLVAALVCASTRLGIGADTEIGQKNVDLTIKSHSCVNYLRIVNNKYPVITGPVQ